MPLTGVVAAIQLLGDDAFEPLIACRLEKGETLAHHRLRNVDSTVRRHQLVQPGLAAVPRLSQQ